MDAKVAGFVAECRGLRVGAGIVTSPLTDDATRDPLHYYLLAGGHITPGVIVVVPDTDGLRHCYYCTYLTHYRKVQFGNGGRYVSDIKVVCPDCSRLWDKHGSAGMAAALARHLAIQADPVRRLRYPSRLNTHAATMQTILLRTPSRQQEMVEWVQAAQQALVDRLRAKHETAIVGQLPPIDRRRWKQAQDALVPAQMRSPASVEGIDDVLEANAALRGLLRE